MFETIGSRIQKISPLVISSIAATTFYGIVVQPNVPTATAQSIQSTVQLEGITWQISEWRSSNGKPITLLPKNPITVRFDGKRLGGSTGCNFYGADYQLQGSRLRLLGNIASTMIGCTPEIAQRESWFATALNASNLTIRQASNRLTLTYTTASGQGVMTFTPLSSKLRNTTWRLNQSNSPIRREPPITLRFTADSVGGFSGCNQFSASYQDLPNQLKIGAIASTKKACATPVMNRELSFLSQIAAVQRYEIDSSGSLRLFFQNSNQSGSLTFSPQK